MKRASITEVKIGLSGLLSQVRRGEAVLITHRGRPVARLEPCRTDPDETERDIAELVRRGVATPPRERLDIERFLSVPLVRVKPGPSPSQIISQEREESY